MRSQPSASSGRGGLAAPSGSPETAGGLEQTSARERALGWGLGCLYLAFLVLLLACVVLLGALLGGDTGFRYVIDNWAPSLPTLYRISAFWAGQEGSFLLWAFLVLGAGSLVAVRGAREPRRELGAGAALVMALIGAFIVLLMLVDRGSDPFASAPSPAPDPAGLNPLLLHPAMALHPPALFLGYVGLAVPFAYAVSALWLRRLDSLWTRPARTWTLAGWVLLSIGIGLGAWWAYVILSWGGYWGWDPVENTSLVPWLTATALLHTFSVYERAPVFRRWAVSLAVLTFWLTVLATWTTRTGLVQSLHAFEQRTTLVIALSIALGLAAAAGIWLIAGRWRLLAASDGRDEREPAHGAREMLHEVANVALTAVAGAIAFATVVMPVAFGQSVRARTYDTLARPLGAAIVTLLAVCPLIWSGGRPTARSVLRRLFLPLAAAAVAVLGLGLSGWTSSPGGLVTLAVAAFAGAAAIEWLAIRAGAGGRGLSAGAFARALSGSRAATGGFIAHLGMALILAGLAGTSFFAVRDVVDLPVEAAASAVVGGYTLALRGFEERVAPQDGRRIAAVLEVTRDGRDLGSVAPALDLYAGSDQTFAQAGILGGAWRDLFVSPQSFSAERLRADVIVFPLIRLLWAGAAVLVLGGVVALLPRRLPTAARAPAAARDAGEYVDVAGTAGAPAGGADTGARSEVRT